MGARFPKQILSIFALLWLSCACTSTPTADPRDTVPYLASDQLAGRAPGSPGLVTAGDYLADEFRRIGLQPLPQLHGYFQPFTMTLSSTLGPATNLLVNDKSLTLGTDFSPLSVTSEGPFRGPLVFVGFGVSQTNSPTYDDYAGMDVAGKAVLAMRQEPRDEKGKSRLAENGRTW